MYKALVFFRDTQDGNYIYHVGDAYPREGYEPPSDRLESLLSGKNRQGKPVIAKEGEEPRRRRKK